MSPPNDPVPSRVELDLQAHARILTELTTKISSVERDVAVMKVENKFQDEKLSSIYGLGRTVLITLVTLALGLVFAFFANGGFRVPPIA